MEERYLEGGIFENRRFFQEEFQNLRIEECRFVNCIFEECKMTACFLSDCEFYECKVIGLGESRDSRLQNVGFFKCLLIGVNWGELQARARFAEPVKSFRGCCMKYNTFSEMNFKGFDFSGNEIRESLFSECGLRESCFKGCMLERTEFYQCDMRKADFRDASGYKPDLLSCKMRGAIFSFPEAVTLLDSLGILIE